MKTKFFVIAIMILIITLYSRSYAQPSVSVPYLTYSIPPDTDVIVPLWGNNWNHENANCITLNFNKYAMAYTGCSYINPILPFCTIIVNNQTGQLHFDFLPDSNGITFTSDTLFKLSFIYDPSGFMCGWLVFDTDTSFGMNGCYFPTVNNGGINCPTTNSESISKLFDFQVFPNPARNELNVRLSETKFSPVILKLLSTNGTLLIEKCIDNTNDNCIIDASNLPDGAYTICAQATGSQLSCKNFVIVH